MSLYLSPVLEPPRWSLLYKQMSWLDGSPLYSHSCESMYRKKDTSCLPLLCPGIQVACNQSYRSWAFRDILACSSIAMSNAEEKMPVVLTGCRRVNWGQVAHQHTRLVLTQLTSVPQLGCLCKHTGVLESGIKIWSTSNFYIHDT